MHPFMDMFDLYLFMVMLACGFGLLGSLVHIFCTQKSQYVWLIMLYRMAYVL